MTPNRRTEIALLVMLVSAACSHVGANSKADSPYAAASGITRTEGADSRAFRVVPLRPLSGDAEILYGDPEKPGEPFAMRIRELPGTIIPLHTHPVDEHITIVQGTWYFAVGDTWDKSKLNELRTGDYAFAPKGSTMFGYCPDGAIVQVHGIGPFQIHFLHGTKTLDDADASATFTFKRGERVQTPRGRGTIRNGYASGVIIQYEIAGDDGTPYMSNQSETSRIAQ